MRRYRPRRPPTESLSSRLTTTMDDRGIALPPSGNAPPGWWMPTNIVRRSGDQVSPVIQSNGGLLRQSLTQMAVVGFVVLPADGVSGNAFVLHQGRGHIILGGERI